MSVKRKQGNRKKRDWERELLQLLLLWSIAHKLISILYYGTVISLSNAWIRKGTDITRGHEKALIEPVIMKTHLSSPLSRKGTSLARGQVKLII